MKTIRPFRNLLLNPGFKPVLLNRLETLLPHALSMLAILYLLWVLLNWPQLPGLHAPLAANPDLQTAHDNASMAAADYLQMAEWQLMGQESPDSRADQSADALTETPLQLKLLGTFFLSQQPHNSYAVIQSAEGTAKKYRLGEALAEGASLHAVEQHRVVLKHHQQLEYLAFDPNQLAVLAPHD